MCPSALPPSSLPPLSPFGPPPPRNQCLAPSPPSGSKSTALPPFSPAPPLPSRHCSPRTIITTGDPLPPLQPIPLRSPPPPLPPLLEAMFGDAKL
mmetsp:Transcript_27930/g.85254  ORF Transcript_27930/g.85254 Transcript_27930/m.85254 type:complete len:95 (+) Transcript_27930:483-767(+)